MIGIYKITNLATNEIYIGSSVNIEHRWANHKCASTWKHCPDSKLYLDFQTYGLQNFEFSVIENCEIEDLKKKEEYKNYQKNYQKTYHSKICNFLGETLTINALSKRFRKQGIPHPVIEAKKYLVS